MELVTGSPIKTILALEGETIVCGSSRIYESYKAEGIWELN